MPAKNLIRWTVATVLAAAAVVAAVRAVAWTAHSDGTPAVSVVAAPSRNGYTGPCPPSAERAPSFQAIITVPRGPATVTYRWLTGRGITDPPLNTVHLAGTGWQSVAVAYTETSHIPDQTYTDWVAVQVSSPQAVESNHLTLTTTCHSARPHRLDPGSAVLDQAPIR
jgi:hypothetical protein